MENARKIAHNTAWQIIGRIIGTAFGVISIGLLTRYLGQENFGYYTTAVAFMQFFGVLLDMGLYLVCLKEISAKPEQENFIVSNIFTLRIISAIIFMGGAAALIFVFPYPPVVKLAGLIVSLAFFFTSLIQTLTAVFQKYLKMGQVALAEVIGRLVFLLAVIVFIFYRQNLPALIWANVINAFVYLVILWFLVKKYVQIKLQINWTYWQTIFKLSWPIALGVVLNLVYFRADTIILSLFKPATDVGIYGAPYKILEIIATFPHMFMGLVTPALTVTWLNKNLESFKENFQKTFDFFIILIIPLILGTLPLADRIMKLVAGKDFIASGPVLAILMIATGVIFLGVMMTYCLVVLDKQKTMLKFFLIAAILSLIGYFIFIPKYSYFGAAWVTVAVEAFIVLSSWLIFYQTTKIKLNFQSFIKSLAAAILMYLAIVQLMPNWHLLLTVGVAIIIYFAALLLIGGIDKKSLIAILKR